ncbi:hypothetical protein BaRGS_00020245, partial [Batillaria attramentaria]
MTHNEQRAHWIREGVIGLGVGVLYGVTTVVVGHPFDTLKTKMQAQSGFEHTSMVQTFWKTLKNHGIREAAFHHSGGQESIAQYSLLPLKQ